MINRMGSAWMIVSAFLFAAMGALVKYATQEFHFNFYELVFWRTVCSMSLLGLMAVVQKKRFVTPHWFRHIGRGVAGTLGLLLFFYCLQHLPLATATTLNYTSSIFLAVLSFLLLKECIERRMMIALLLGFLGVVVLLQPTWVANQEWAGIMGLLGGLCAAWAYLQVRQLSELGEPSWRIVFYFSLVATMVTGSLATLKGWSPITTDTVPAIIGIGLTGTAAQICLTRAYQVGRKFLVAVLSYLTVVFSMLFGWILFSESVGLLQTIGIFIIVLSGVLGSLKNIKRNDDSNVMNNHRDRLEAK